MKGQLRTANVLLLHRPIGGSRSNVGEILTFSRDGRGLVAARCRTMCIRMKYVGPTGVFNS